MFQKISPEDVKYMQVVSGKKRILKVMNVDNKDEGKYTCKMQDKSTSAKLYVAREYNKTIPNAMLPIVLRIRLSASE